MQRKQINTQLIAHLIENTAFEIETVEVLNFPKLLLKYDHVYSV